MKPARAKCRFSPGIQTGVKILSPGMIGSTSLSSEHAGLGQMIAEDLRHFDARLPSAGGHVGDVGRIDAEDDLPQEAVGPAQVDPHRAGRAD